MKIHYSVIILVSICVIAVTVCVIMGQLPAATMVTIVTGILGWLAPSPLGVGRVLTGPGGGTSISPPAMPAVPPVIITTKKDGDA